MAKTSTRLWWSALILTILGLAGMAFVQYFLLEALFPEPSQLQSARWLLNSGKYKREVLAQPTGTNRNLKHIEWDGWGWGGIDTVVYLVFDPDNALAQGAASGLAGKYPGLPCEVDRIHRLENHWFTVQFYTDTDWDHCR